MNAAAEQGPERKRLFFALWPDDKLRIQLEDVVRPLREVCSGRPVPAENYHITLEFLGNTPVEQMPALIDAANTVKFAPLAFTLDRWGCFAGPKAAWIGPSSYPPALSNLVRDLRSVAAPLVQLQPERLYKPHVTAIRKQPALPDLPPPRTVVWSATDFVLVESIFGEGRADYRVLKRFQSH